MSKKEKILDSALELFGTEGYAATSTKKIAHNAGVSEGLIFRHFANKEGLVNAIFKLGEEKFKALYANILNESVPVEVLRKMINLPFELKIEEYEFWRLQYRLKWELQFHNPEKTKPLTEKLSWAFAKLEYDEPNEEAVFLNNYLEGLASHTLLGQPIEKNATRNFLFKKYNIPN